MRSLIIITLLSVSSVSLAQDQKPCPCCTDEHQQFHFWVGDWEAYNPQGKLVGTNNIVLLEDKCIMQENWKSATANYTGTSYNWYDRSTGLWHQSWIDNQGGSLQLSGKLEGKNMVLSSGELKDQKGAAYSNRITWTPNDDGSVRQHWEVTKDEGESWSTLFDGLYKKVAEK